MGGKVGTFSMKAQHIIFDLDGTLWNPTEVSMEAWSRACMSNGVDPSMLTRSNFAKAYGHVATEVAHIVLPGVDLETARQILDAANREENELIPTRLGKLFEGVPEILQNLKRTHHLYMCSNCQAGYIEAFLRTYGLEHLFSDSICPGDTGHRKPENLSILLQRNNMQDAIMVGDMDSDREAARINHIPFIHAAYGFGSVDEYDARIASLRELPDLLA
jgi:phosphoglycolate phosphatase